MVGFAPAKHSTEGVAYLADLIHQSPGFGPDWVSKNTAPLENEASNIDLAQQRFVDVSAGGADTAIASLEIASAIYMPSEV